MREIKFRAWCKGLHIMLPCGEIAAAVNPYDQIVLTDILKRDCYELMQYTGLKDKNGVEIYESDLVKPPHDRDWVYEVYWGDRDSSWRLRIRGEMQYDKTTALMFAHRGEVIGNIYENGDLLNEVD